MNQISVSLSMLLNSLAGAVNAAYTQSSDPSPINSTPLNANLTSLVANVIAPKLPAGVGAIVGGIGPTAAGIATLAAMQQCSNAAMGSCSNGVQQWGQVLPFTPIRQASQEGALSGLPQ